MSLTADAGKLNLATKKVFLFQNLSYYIIMRNVNVTLVKPVTALIHKLRYTSIVIIIVVTLQQMSCTRGVANICHLYNTL